MYVRVGLAGAPPQGTALFFLKHRESTNRSQLEAYNL
jgi:hypothetical protein